MTLPATHEADRLRAQLRVTEAKLRGAQARLVVMESDRDRLQFQASLLRERVHELVVVVDVLRAGPQCLERGLENARCVLWQGHLSEAHIGVLVNGARHYWRTGAERTDGT